MSDNDKVLGIWSVKGHPLDYCWITKTPGKEYVFCQYTTPEKVDTFIERGIDPANWNHGIATLKESNRKDPNDGKTRLEHRHPDFFGPNSLLGWEVGWKNQTVRFPEINEAAMIASGLVMYCKDTDDIKDGVAHARFVNSLPGVMVYPVPNYVLVGNVTKKE